MTKDEQAKIEGLRDALAFHDEQAAHILCEYFPEPKPEPKLTYPEVGVDPDKVDRAKLQFCRAELAELVRYDAENIGEITIQECLETFDKYFCPPDPIEACREELDNLVVSWSGGQGSMAAHDATEIFKKWFPIKEGHYDND